MDRLKITLEMLAMIALVILAEIFIIRPFLGGLVSVVVYILLIILLIVLAYLVLAPNNLFVTFVPENKVKFVVKGGKISKILISSRNYFLDKNYKVCRKKTNTSTFWSKHFGGFMFYGIWPISDILTYNFKWQNLSQGQLHLREEVLDTMLLKEDTYLMKITKVEDKERMPMEIIATLVIRIINPYKAKALIQNWLESTINIIGPDLRDEFRKKSFQSLIDSKEQLGEEIFKELVEKGTLAKIGEDWGVYIKTLRIDQINPQDEELRNITLQKVKADADAEAKKIAATAERDAILLEKEGWEKAGIDPTTAYVSKNMGKNGGSSSVSDLYFTKKLVNDKP